MKIIAQTYCNKCSRKVNWQWKYGQSDALAKAWNIIFPTQIAGGTAHHSLNDYCWECYGKVCDKMNKIYESEHKQRLTFDVNIKVVAVKEKKK